MNIIKDFHPIWFVSVMGTGITSAVLYNFPYHADWLKICGIIMFGINSFLLLFTTTLFMVRIIKYQTTMYLYEPKYSVFIGCLAMGYTSWCNMLYFLTGKRCIIFLYVLWWIGNTITLFTAWYIFYCLIKHSKGSISLENFNTTLLLPIVPLTVVSSSAGIFYNDLPDSLKLSTNIIAFLLWANSMVVAFMITTLYVGKMLIHRSPPIELVFTSFIPIGFLGQGAFAIQLFGLNYNTYQLSLNDSIESKIIAYSIQYISLFIGLFLETFGFFLTFISIISVVSYTRELKFHKGWWAMTFPMGTMCLSTNETFKQTGWEAFKVIATIYGLLLIAITITCLIGSLVYEVPWKRAEAREREEEKKEEV